MHKNVYDKGRDFDCIKLKSTFVFCKEILLKMSDKKMQALSEDDLDNVSGGVSAYDLILAAKELWLVAEMDSLRLVKVFDNENEAKRYARRLALEKAGRGYFYAKFNDEYSSRKGLFSEFVGHGCLDKSAFL